MLFKVAEVVKVFFAKLTNVYFFLGFLVVR